MIKPETLKVIKATVPVLKEHGEALTRLFYKRMFANNPEVKPFFNQAHQEAGAQQKALAAAICAYAEHIDNPSVLADAVELIAQKHASLGVKAEHYPIVGTNLLAAIRELLGDAATEEIINAWAEAYMVLAEILINREQAIYDEHDNEYGWQGFKTFKVVKKEPNSSLITSFYLAPEDGQTLAAHKPGQYITVKIPAGENSSTMRNYSLSNAPGSDYFRISVKHEKGAAEQQPEGVVSSFLHNALKEGDQILVGPPCGEFTLQPGNQDNTAQVFIAGGVGVTPLLSMVHAALEQASGEQPVVFIQTARNGDVHAFRDELSVLAQQHPNLKWHVRYSEPTVEDKASANHDSEGLLDADLVTSLLQEQNAAYYLCGPKPMIKHGLNVLDTLGIPSDSVHYELFGPAETL